MDFHFYFNLPFSFGFFVYLYEATNDNCSVFMSQDTLYFNFPRSLPDGF